MELVRQRCLHHATREAVARCPRCGHTFCRECVTEHEGRVLCATCLRALTARRGLPAGRLWAQHLLLLAAGLALLWVVFYLVGCGLARIPASVHEGTLWQQPWLSRGPPRPTPGTGGTGPA